VEPKERGRQLYYGERTAADLVLSKFAAWEAQGFEVIPVLSQPDATEGRTDSRMRSRKTGIAIPEKFGRSALWYEGMTESVKDILNKAGVFEGRVIFLKYTCTLN
jgi:NAD(P)H-flavin reductase